MAPPSEPAGPGSPHAAVKHELLVRYLDAWTPAVLHAARRVCYADGYAGAGLGAARPGGSPGAALGVFGEFADRLAGHELTMVLVEADAQRAGALGERLAAAHGQLGSPAELCIHLVRGRCAHDLVPALERAGALGGPVFAYLDAASPDPAGAEPPLDVVAAVARHRSSEVLVTLDAARLAGLTGGDDPAGDRLFGGVAWRRCADQPAALRFPYLVTAYREALRGAGLACVVHVELVDGAGGAQVLFFGTRSARNLEQFKAELWAVDEYAGVRYRDPRDAEHELLDISFAPPLASLRRALLAAATDRTVATMAELRQFAAAETMFRAADANRALTALVASGALRREPAKGRLSADTVLRPAPA
jgi:three-Cys-motif partner protein